MQAYGSDRLAAREDGTFVLSSRLPKGWQPRVEKTLTTAEFPGTAVLWDEQYFEVIAAEGVTNGVRYTLAPWPEHHTMRVSDAYDAASEERRLAEWRQHLARQKHRKTAILLGVFIGHLPAVVQEHLASELGILASRLSLVSCLPEIAYFVASIFWFVDWYFGRPPVPPSLIFLGGLVGLDAIVRLLTIVPQGHPIGSPFGMIAYLIWYAIDGRGRNVPPPFAVEKGRGTVILPPPEDVAAADAFHVREPLMTLLSPAEQERAATRYGYDYRHTSRTVAILILVSALLGMLTSIRELQGAISFPAVSSLIVAATLAIEQIVRLHLLRKGPAGSILAFFVRPLVRRYV